MVRCWLCAPGDAECWLLWWAPQCCLICHDVHLPASEHERLAQLHRVPAVQHQALRAPTAAVAAVAGGRAQELRPAVHFHKLLCCINAAKRLAGGVCSAAQPGRQLRQRAAAQGHVGRMPARQGPGRARACRLALLDLAACQHGLRQRQRQQQQVPWPPPHAARLTEPHEPPLIAHCHARCIAARRRCSACRRAQKGPAIACCSRHRGVFEKRCLK